MTEKIYPELHIEKLKILVEGLGLNQPKPEKICLFKSVPAAAQPISAGPKDPRYLIVIVGPDGFEPWVGDLNDLLELNWGPRSLADELAECFIEKPEERFIKDSFMFWRIPTELYASGEWAYENDSFIDEDGKEIFTQKVYDLNLNSELVLFDRSGKIEKKRAKIAKPLSENSSKAEMAKHRWKQHNSLMEEALNLADEKWAKGDDAWHNEMSTWLVNRERFKDLRPYAAALRKKLIPISDKYGRTRGKKGMKKEKN